MKKTFALTALVVAMGAGALCPAQSIEPLKIGEPAPAFTLPGVDGTTYTLESFSTATLLTIVFTSNHCPSAQAYEDRIVQVVNDYRDKGVAVVAITPNSPLGLRLDELGYTDLGDDFEDTRRRWQDAGFNFPYLYDGDIQAVSKSYGPRATPHVFVFDEERKLRYEGGIDDSEHLSRVRVHHLRNALDALLAGEAVPRTGTPTFGCSIKWAEKQSEVEAWNQRVAQEVVTLNAIDAAGVAALLKNDSDKLRLINVWATWCGPCRAEMPELVRMNLQYRNRPFEMVTISVDDPDTHEEVQKVLGEYGASMRNFYFSSKDKNELVEALGEHWKGAIPFLLLIKPGGEIVMSHTGAADPLATRRAIVDILGRTYTLN